MAEKKVQFGVQFEGIAELTSDNTNTAPAYGTIEKDVLPAAKITLDQTVSTATIYYDNKPAIVRESLKANKLSLSTDRLDSVFEAKLLGNPVDEENGIIGGGGVNSEPKNFAFGFSIQMTNGTEQWIWALKTRWTKSGAEENPTAADGTDTSGSEFEATMSAPAFTWQNPAFQRNDLTYVVMGSDNSRGITKEEFFNQVQTFDSLNAPNED
jgi:phi13 family phage major tail protein